jgi:hypothetical protein
MKKVLATALVLSTMLIPVGAQAASAAPANHIAGIINPETTTYGPKSFSITNYVYVNGGSAFYASSTVMTVQISGLSGSVTATIEKQDGTVVSNYNFSSNGSHNFTVTKGGYYKVKLSGSASGNVTVIY